MRMHHNDKTLVQHHTRVVYIMLYAPAFTILWPLHYVQHLPFHSPVCNTLHHACRHAWLWGKITESGAAGVTMKTARMHLIYKYLYSCFDISWHCHPYLLFLFLLLLPFYNSWFFHLLKEREENRKESCYSRWPQPSTSWDWRVWLESQPGCWGVFIHRTGLEVWRQVNFAKAIRQ